MYSTASILPAAIVLIFCSQFLHATVVQDSEAFIYPSQMHGQQLASGETFRHDRLTAGHPTIPPGTVVRVTNLSNRMGIDVLVNDRWTGSRSGIILSQAAASMLRIPTGVRARVKIEQLSHPVTRSQPVRNVPAQKKPTLQPVSRPKTTTQGLYFLEFATYKNIVQAKMLSLRLSGRGAPAKVVQDPAGLYHVISDGYFTSLEDASEAYHLVDWNVGYRPVIKKI